MCASPKDLQRIADRHGAIKPPPTKGCESRRRLIRIVPPVAGLWHCFTHTSCICNDIISCVNRVIGEVPLPTVAGLRMIKNERLHIQRKLGMFVPLTLEESLETFKGTKRKIYDRAYSSLLVEPLGPKDGRIKAFVKAEKFDPTDKENPDPRMIQARDPRYNLHLARYLRPIEHAIYGYRIDGVRSVAKCLNPQQRAELLKEKWDMFDDPVCFSLDCSRWDKHISLDVLNEEHAFYEACYPGDLQLQVLLRMQKKNECMTSNGLKYTVVGGRMSGDMNTALGNVFLMVVMIVAAMRNLAVKRYQIMNDGDDCLVLVERSELERLRSNLPKIFLEFGQELKLENITDDIQQVVFCQSKYTFNGDEWVMARNWKKVLSQSCCGTKHWNDPALVPGMFGLIGDCEVAQHRGIPILQVFGERLQQLSGGARSRLLHLDSSYQYRIGSWKLDLKVKPKEITWESRFQFELTWGVSVAEQLEIERIIKGWTPGIVCRDVPSEMCHPWQQILDIGIANPQFL